MYALLYWFWFFKDVGYKAELHICNKCHNVLMDAYELENIAILNVKGVHYRYISWVVSKNEVFNILNNCVIKIKVFL